MKRLLKLQLARTIKQKALWCYLAAMLLIIISNSISLQDPENDFHLIHSGGGFPISALQNQATMIGPLFFALITAFSINGERTSGTLKQPLLIGISRFQLLNCKIINIVTMMASTILLMECLSIAVGFLVWGNAVFDSLANCFLHIGLTVVPLAVHCLGFVLLSLYTPNTAVTMCASFLILLTDNLVSQFFAPAVSNFSYMYYAYAYCGFNANPIEPWMIPKGLLICLVTGVAFYMLAYRRMHRMQY